MTDTPKSIATVWLSDFASALYAADIEAVTSAFLPFGWFRDILTFTWDYRSLEGPDKIRSYLAPTLRSTKISDVKLDVDPHLQPAFFPNPPGSEGVETSFLFETHVGHGKGYVRLLQTDSGAWKALSVCMMLSDIAGHEESGYESGIYGGHTLAWKDVHAERRAKIEADPHVLIVGAGQNGLQVAARFKQVGIPTVVIEKNDRIGDQWRNRYPTLVLHTPRFHHQLLYQPYPHNWPYYTPRDKLADWFETYAQNQDLVVWTKSTIQSKPTYDKEQHKWHVIVNRDGSPVTIRPTHIVLATGTLGAPKIPGIPDQTKFQGQIFHSADYAGGKPFAGKNVVVIGAGNTSIDICQDLVHHQAKSVTMVQRSATVVVSGDNAAKHISHVWANNVDTPVEVGDWKFASTPLGMMKQKMMASQDAQWEEEKELHAKLRQGGLALTLGPEGQGHLILVFERGGGYWLDKGGADLIAAGQVKVKQGVEPIGFTDNTILFTDGSALQADVLIFATGYVNMREVNKELFGAECIDQTGAAYGLDEEGELRASYRPTGHPGLWFATGDFFHSRFMSKQLALQLKARELGLVPF